VVAICAEALKQVHSFALRLRWEEQQERSLDFFVATVQACLLCLWTGSSTLPRTHQCACLHCQNMGAYACIDGHICLSAPKQKMCRKATTNGNDLSTAFNPFTAFTLASFQPPPYSCTHVRMHAHTHISTHANTCIWIHVTPVLHCRHMPPARPNCHLGIAGAAIHI